MALSRYGVIDDYTREELQREYRAQDPHGRIRLLARFPKADDEQDFRTVPLPIEIVQMAAEDDSIPVRQWIARHGRFLQDSLNPVIERLIGDSDPFVRACLMENQTHIGWHNAERAFLFATHLERLGLMRNPDVVKTDKLIWKIFDLDDKAEDPKDNVGGLGELGIDFEQRRQLALALISNPAAQKDSRRDLDNDSYLRLDGWAYFSIRERWSKVWKLAARWPSDSGVPRAVFENISTDDRVKAEIYRDCNEAHSRYSILNGCLTSEQETIKLGLKDSDATCRLTAHQKIWWINLGPEKLEAILGGEDKDALTGLSLNECLPAEVLDKIAKKFEALGDDMQASNVEGTISRVQKKQRGHSRTQVGEESASEITPERIGEQLDAQAGLLRAQAELISERTQAQDDYFFELVQAQSALIKAHAELDSHRSDSQGDFILKLFKAQGDLISGLSTAQTEYLASLSIKPAVLNRAVLIPVLVIAGVALILGAPTEPTIGLTLIGIAIAFVWPKRRNRSRGKQSTSGAASAD